MYPRQCSNILCAAVIAAALISYSSCAVLPQSNRTVDNQGSQCDAVLFEGAESVVCRCNGTHCDVVPEIGDITSDSVVIVSSSKSGNRFAVDRQSIQHYINNPEKGEMLIDIDEMYQSIIGFGGAFTDAASINIYDNLRREARQKLLESYYSPSGIEYTLGRVPIGSTDFSTHAYSYDDVPEDVELHLFSLSLEDTMYKLPLVKEALSMSRRPINLFSSPWTAPAWMKTNNALTGRGYLKGQPGGQYHKSWAKYLVKFLDSYKKEGVEFWGMTVQNEPLDGRVPYFPFQCMGFTADTQRDFIAEDLGPALEEGGYSHVKLITLDDDLVMLPQWAETIYRNESSSKYISGLGLHWYMNGYFSHGRLTDTHNVDPSKFILATEACAGSGMFDQKVVLGSWDRAEQYTDDIIKDLSNWVAGWTDWNIALNLTGGPNWVNNNVDSPIIVNQEKNEFYKQPMFYAMGHFSKYLIPGSRRLKSEISGLQDVQGVAFLTPDDNIVVELLNSGDNTQTLQVKQSTRDFSVILPAHSIITLIWKK